MYVTQAKVQSPSSMSTNPFLSSPTNNVNQPIVDLFGAVSASESQQVTLYHTSLVFGATLINDAISCKIIIHCFAAAIVAKGVGRPAAVGGQSVRQHVRSAATDRARRAACCAEQHVDDQWYW